MYIKTTKAEFPLCKHSCRITMIVKCMFPRLPIIFLIMIKKNELAFTTCCFSMLAQRNAQNSNHSCDPMCILKGTQPSE